MYQLMYQIQLPALLAAHSLSSMCAAGLLQQLPGFLWKATQLVAAGRPVLSAGPSAPQ
jgi:hypothetical protein